MSQTWQHKKPQIFKWKAQLEENKIHPFKGQTVYNEVLIRNSMSKCTEMIHTGGHTVISLRLKKKKLKKKTHKPHKKANLKKQKHTANKQKPKSPHKFRFLFSTYLYQLQMLLKTFKISPQYSFLIDFLPPALQTDKYKTQNLNYGRLCYPANSAMPVQDYSLQPIC